MPLAVQESDTVLGEALAERARLDWVLESTLAGLGIELCAPREAAEGVRVWTLLVTSVAKGMPDTRLPRALFTGAVAEVAATAPVTVYADPPFNVCALLAKELAAVATPVPCCMMLAVLGVGATFPTEEAAFEGDGTLI